MSQGYRYDAGSSVGPFDDWVLPILGTVAVVAVAGIPFLQSDVVSRQILSSQKLQTKRLETYKYRWEKYTTKALLQTLEQVGGDQNLVLLVHEEELKEFIERCCGSTSRQNNSKKPSNETVETVHSQKRPTILGIGIDEQIASRELCIWIYFDQLIYQASLINFGRLLAEIMDQKLTTTALCFVADASGGLGTTMLTSVLESCSMLQVPVIKEPTWLAQFAVLVEEGYIATDKLEKCLFGLLRLEAHGFHEKTVCVTLPGQAVTAPLLPILQRVFPCERHVFVYDTCANVVSRCLFDRKLPEHPQRTLRQSFQFSIRHTSPLDRSLTKQVVTLSDALQNLPMNFADTTECWMTSVNAMLKLKEDEKTNDYLPFVCRLPFLLTQGTQQERELALMNVLQFITGSRSRPLPNGTMEEAIGHVSQHYTSSNGTPTFMTIPPKLAVPLLRAVENCVFCHKSILLGDKILMDTVLPNREWSLKAAKKISGCSCCGPPDDDDDEDDSNLDQTKNSMKPLVTKVLQDIDLAMPKKKKSTFVDGTSGFAFDPNKFT